MTQKPFLKSTTFHFIMLIAILAGCWYCSTLFHIDQQAMKAWFDSIPAWFAWPLFALAYVGLTFIIWFAKDILKIVGAVVFGAYISTLLIWVAEVVNAVVLFQLSRRLGRHFVVEKFKISEEQIQKAQENVSWLQMFVFRSVPLIPFRFLDLGYGLTSVPQSKYLLVTAIASPVRIFWIQFVLAGVGDAILANGIDQSVGLIINYFLEHTEVLQWSAAYVVFAFVAILILKFISKKGQGQASDPTQSLPSAPRIE